MEYGHDPWLWLQFLLKKKPAKISKGSLQDIESELWVFGREA